MPWGVRGSVLSLLFREGRGRGSCRQDFCQHWAELDMCGTCWQLRDYPSG